MAACSEVEEKASFSKDSVPSKIFLGETAGRSELSNKLSDRTKEELNNMSENAFQDLLENIVSYNKPMNFGCSVIKDLMKEVSETHEKPNVGKHSEYKHNKTLLCDSTNSSNHRTLDEKKKLNKIRDDSKNALNSDKNIQQSISLQDLLSPDTKTRKYHHKAQRTLSLSSEEAANVISDSLAVNFKSTKKSNKQSSSVKNQTNKSSSNKCASKISDNSGFTSSNLDSGQKRKQESFVHNSSMPYESLVNDSDIPSLDDNANKDKADSSNLVEIEMEEIKSDKLSKDRYSVQHLETSKNSSQQSSSKFYIDSNDIDATPNCSIQFNSYRTMDDHNGDQLTFPVWSKTAQSFITSLGNEDYHSRSGHKNFPENFTEKLEVTSLNKLLFQPVTLSASKTINGGEKQILNADINGNPFSRSPRTSLASIVSTTLLDYSNNTLISENKNRKNKRLRNTINKGVLAENIAGHRGEDDIDTLLQYINSSDKKGKAVKGNPQNHLVSSKAILHDDKKKGFGKDIKNCKNMISNVKKKLSRSNSMENLSSSNQNVNDEKDNALSYESNAMLDKPLKNSKSLRSTNHKILDINSNVEHRLCVHNGKNKSLCSTDESFELNSNFEQSSPEVSSFAADFYSTADVSSQTVEEGGFLIVKKKQRKKHQGKRSDSYRWRTTQNQRKKGMMLPLAESKCGKQDSRRKSTSSVPHSEHSSADNSDLDSVHSLPVRGSVPHPTQPHPHTTPSSSSSTPQASYADIARMPIPKLNSPSPCIITYSAQASVVKQQTSDSEFKKPDTNLSSFPYTKRKLELRETTPVVNKTVTPTPVIDDINFPDVKVRSLAKSTRENNTQTEPDPAVNENSCTENENTKTKKEDETCKNLCAVCSCSQKKNCSCSKSQTHFRHKIKCSDIPPVIMDNMPAETNTCNVSFGFGVEEVLQMTPIETSELNIDVKTLVNDNRDLRVPEKSMCTVVNSTQSDNDSYKTSVTVPLKVVNHNSDLSNETSSHLQTICYGTGRNICYSETKVNTKKFNLTEITNFLGTEFQCIEKELGLSKNNGISSKVVYYIDSTEEA